MRFCFLTTFYPPYHFGGDAISIQRFARGLARRGHHVTVVHDADAFHALHRGAAPGAEPEPPGIEAIPLRSGWGPLSTLLTQQTGQPVFNGNRIEQILQDGRFDVIQFHNVSLLGGPGLFRLGSAVKLYMAHEHWLVCPTHVLWRRRREPCTGRECLRCQLAYRRPPQLWRSTGLLERELRHIDAFLAMSEFSRAKHREFGFPREMEVLPCFVPADARTPADDPGERPQPRRYFFVAGRLERIKGIQDVIPLFRNFPDADLLIAGRGPEDASLRALAAGVPNVRFVGWLDQRDLAHYYRHAIAVIVPSAGFETFGMTLIEAFEQSTPVIARRIGPFPEMIEASQGGMLFESPEDLARAIETLASDPVQRERLGKCGRAAVMERWSESVVLPKYLEIVNRAAERRLGAKHT